MTENEKKILSALASMVIQYLEGREVVDSHSMSAGEEAIEVLAAFGLMEVVGTRFGRWTEEGKTFLREMGYTRLDRLEQVDHLGAIRLVVMPKPDK
ncbi:MULTISPECIES: hypothetical protein [unclassified Bradyrhizobium]|uniref:hypothetical protein n=1 Tax=Bradyrhizobium TaxID=374 RepID=UPI002916011D|nr:MULTISPECIES: hypothetical protein [unclassified Bradyrhizobium]